MHALRGFISPVLYWPLLLWLNSNLKAILLQFWNSAWRWERNACDVKKRTVKFPMGIFKRSFFCVYKKHFSPISSKSSSNCREINQKSLVAYTEELNSLLRRLATVLLTLPGVYLLKSKFRIEDKLRFPWYYTTFSTYDQSLFSHWFPSNSCHHSNGNGQPLILNNVEYLEN